MASTSPVTGERPAVLTVINPSGQRSRVILSQSPFLIGRQSDNHLVLRDNRVSRVHARILREQGDYFIEDLNSRHGLYVNGARAAGRHKLGHADTINFGFPDSYQLVFLQEEGDLSRLADQVATSSRVTTSPGGGNLAKLRALVEVARALQGSLSIEEVLESVVDAALAVTGAQRGFLLLRQGDELTVSVARDSKGARLGSDELRVPTRLIHRALNSRREPLFMHFDPTAEGGVTPDVSVANLELRSVVCVPLIRVRTEISPDTMHAALNETVGLLYMDSRIGVADMAGGNRELLQSLAIEASTVLENARLLEQERAKQRLEQELAIARDIQRGLLPRELPSTGWFRVAASSVPSHQVGGDYYDVTRIPPDCWSLVVADVSGKGVSSGLLASLLQGAFQMASQEPDRIAEMFHRISRYLYERTQGEKYATLFYGAVDPAGCLRWANAAHCAPLLVRRDCRIESLNPTGMPVGILDIAEYEVVTTQLEPGDKLVIYSDGVSEAQNAGGQFFEIERIRGVLRATAASDAATVHRMLLNAVQSFIGATPQRDDMTLLVAEYVP
jgi:serine phosphatase RsbU (regulator of sigma subunit)